MDAPTTAGGGSGLVGGGDNAAAATTFAAAGAAPPAAAAVVPPPPPPPPTSAAAAGPTAASAAAVQQQPLSVHPLSIVSMADQYTRVVCGGSALGRAEPVAGLLFGTTTTTTAVDGGGGGAPSGSGGGGQSQPGRWSVTDAEEFPFHRHPPPREAIDQNRSSSSGGGGGGGAEDAGGAARQQILLHQAVYPQHTVVGWYRVSATDASPVPDDLLLSLQLAKQHHHHPHTTPPRPPFLFALLSVKAEPSSAMKIDSNSDDDDHDDGIDAVPLALFAVDPASQVLVGLEERDWILHTATAERIAVERVCREPPPKQQQLQSQSQQPSRWTGTADPATRDAVAAAEAVPLRFMNATAPIQQSVAALQERVGAMQHYLHAVADGRVPSDPATLRRIQGLVRHAEVLGATAAAAATATADTAAATSPTPTATSTTVFGGNDGDASLDLRVQQLAALAKTVVTVQRYADKARVVHEAAAAASSSRVAPGAAGRRIYDCF